ncbi:hypothetical protein NO932_05590 [Pelagibacterium sp. 26DY04]|uniref:hypothetical protein n=1 Tax=Pelagibacterium sp. 26DY04 TaxID=2967130 RepID=UPI002815FBA5|nr:hypothetical protein [Pelagibacterium sp. 26DY04]WMT88081.1 hypothetical protein NO932_05590 [Pelagibacterium sp. 26DY04]
MPAGEDSRMNAARDAFLAALSGVLVEPPVFHFFSGAIERDAASSIWAWMARDIAQAEAARLGDAIEAGADPLQAFDEVLPDLLGRLKENAAAEKEDRELERRNSMQMGGEEARRRLPSVIVAMRRRPLLVQAERFGVAVGTIADEATLAAALQSISITNPITRALWMQAMVGQMANPSRAMAAAVVIAGGNSESRITNAGYSPLVEAVLSHAQGQIGKLAGQSNLFSDIDFVCRSIDRFHRLMRAINSTLEIERRSVWGAIIADLIGKLSERLERPMKEITINVSQALRRPRDGNDRVDADQVLAALNGLYLLTTVRQSRDSLAVNALLDQAWTETGQAVEVLVTRALDHYRANPGDAAARERVEAGIKMAEIRFNAEYAEILRRARDNAERRTAPL